MYSNLKCSENKITYSCVKNRIFFQTKLFINQPDDRHEQDADTVADKVNRIPEPRFTQYKCAEYKEEEKLQQRPLHCVHKKGYYIINKIHIYK
jgi:hypothetical protein